MAMRHPRSARNRPPFDLAALEQTALGYASRYATSRARLAAFLERKLGERGWSGDGEPPVAALVERMATLGYVDDRAFAAASAASLLRRGYGERRVGAALRAARIGDEDSTEARAAALDGAWASALRFAERKRIGPFAVQECDRATRDRALAALLRAGHRIELALKLVRARPGEIPEADGC